MAKSIGELSVVIGAEVSEFKRAMGEMKTGITDANKAIGKAERDWKKSFGNIEKQIRNVGIAMAGLGTAIVGGMFKMADNAGKLGEELINLKAKTGMSVESLSELKYMADTTGASLDTVETAVKAMNNALDDALKNTNKENTAFKRLNLSVEALKKMKPEERFWAIAEALAEVQDEGERSALAVDIFGKSGTDLIPILDAGKDGLDAMKQKARELGVVMSEESAQKAADFNQSMDDMKKALEGLQMTVAELVTPALKGLIDDLSSVISNIKDWAAQNPGLMDALLKLGGVLAVGGAFLIGLAEVSKLFLGLNAAWTTATKLLPGLTTMLGTSTTGLAGALGYVGLAIAGIAGWAIAIDNIVKNFDSWVQLMKQAPWQTFMNLIKYGSLLPGSDVKLSVKAKESLGKAGYAPGSLPGYAEGGIVSSPTLAMVGESGPEAIIPLPDLKGRGGDTYQLIVNGSIMTETDLFEKWKHWLANNNRRNFHGPSNLGYGFGTSST